MRSVDEVWVGFTEAVIRVELPGGAVVVRPAPPGRSGRFPFSAPVHIVTACNPAGVEIDEAANATRTEALAARLRGHEVVATVGSGADGSMAEPGFAVLAVSTDEACALGREFGQRAIYRWSAEALEILGLDGDPDHRMGWELATGPGGS